VIAAVVDVVMVIGQRVADITRRYWLGLLRFQHFCYENFHQINKATTAGIAKTARKIGNSSATE
jgi:hypothetical protein